MAKSHQAGSVHEALDALMGQIETKTGTNGYQAAADFEDVTKFTLYKQVDPDNAAEMSFARVVRLSEHFGATAALDLLAERLDCVVVCRSQVATDTNLITHLSTLACESGQAIQAIAEGIADQVETEAELERIIKEARELRAAAAAAELAAECRLEAMRAKVSPIRSRVA